MHRSLLAIALGLLAACGTNRDGTARERAALREDVAILNASFDATRELYEEFNSSFAQRWEERTGQKVEVRQSHGGSGKQARAILDGLEADVATLALAWDIEALVRGGAVQSGWQSELPTRSSPFYSTVVFVVRAGNPLQIHDWEDLARPGVEVITPNPKTSGGARWNYLAAWGWAEREGGEERARDFVTRLYGNVPVLDSGARGSTTTFVQREIGDVLIAWESEALLAAQSFAEGEIEIVYPSSSIRADLSVAVVDRVVDERGTRRVAQAYLCALYEPWAQEIAARHHYRPRDPDAVRRHRFEPIDLFGIEEFGGWAEAQQIHFSDGGIFDQIYVPSR